jgi:hypothetical protein
MRIGYACSALALAAFAFAVSAQAGTITLSDVSSDLTPATDLDATLDFVVGEFDGGNAGDELQLTLTNTGADFNVGELYWNVTSNITGLSLLSATHSVNGDVTGLWDPVHTGLSADGFGVFDYAMTDGVGELSPGLATPGDSIVFIMDLDSLAAADMSDFIVANANGYIGAAKFVNGPDDPEAPGNEDSAFGAAVPEPGTAALLSIGLFGLAITRRRV